jgi:hypothetical protein
MNSIAKIKGIEGHRKYLKTLVLSTALAFGMLYIALGLMFFAEVFAGRRENLISVPYILLILAIFFIIFTVFYESKEREKEKGKRKGKESYKPLLKGLFLAICATFAFVAIVGGVKLTVERAFPIGIEAFISALAICMIVSMVFLSLLKPSGLEI